jgi:hypothetical protein
LPPNHQEATDRGPSPGETVTNLVAGRLGPLESGSERLSVQVRVERLLIGCGVAANERIEAGHPALQFFTPLENQRGPSSLNRLRQSVR